MRRIKKDLTTVAVAVFWLLFWQGGAMAVNRRLLIPVPTPISTARAFISLCGDRQFWTAAGASVLRIAVGFVCALVFGTLLAFVCAKIPFFKLLTAPLFGILRAVPVAALIILVFLWVQRQSIPTFIAFVTVLPIFWTDVENGLRVADRGLYEMARVMGMGRWRRFYAITLPLVMPYFASAVSTGIGFAWKAGVAAEVICRTVQSFGDLLWKYKSAVEYESVFALCVVIVAFSVITENVIRRLFRRKGKKA